MFATRGYYRVRSQSFSTFPYSSRITIPHQPPRLVYLILNTSAFARFLDELIGSIDGCQEFLVHVSPHMLLNLVRILASFRIHAVKGPEIESLLENQGGVRTVIGVYMEICKSQSEVVGGVDARSANHWRVLNVFCKERWVKRKSGNSRDEGQGIVTIGGIIQFKTPLSENTRQFRVQYAVRLTPLTKINRGLCGCAFENSNRKRQL